MNRDSMKLLYEKGEKRFVATMINLINEGEIKAEDFSLKALHEAMGAPNLQQMSVINERHIEEGVAISEAMDSTAFPKITGALINKIVMEAYALEAGIGDQLVTVIPSSVRDETIVGFGADAEMKEVPEGIAYEEGSLTEKYHKIRNTKKGRLLALTYEMVKFDQTGQLIMRARQMGEYCKSSRELMIMNSVLELTSTGDLAAWRPAGAATTLYSNTSNDPYTSGDLDNLEAEALADETDVAKATTLFAQFTDEQGLPMNISPKVMLTGRTLEPIAYKIFRSGQTVEKTTPSGTKSLYADKGIQVLASSFVDQKKSATAWFFGDPKKQFVFTEVFPVRVEQQKAGHDDEFKKDIIFRFKAGFFGGCGAVTNRYMVQGNA